MIGADVVLVDGLLDQPHAKQAGVKSHVFPWFRGNGGEVVNSRQLHRVVLVRVAEPPLKTAMAGLGRRGVDVGCGLTRRQRPPPPVSRTEICRATSWSATKTRPVSLRSGVPRKRTRSRRRCIAR